MPPLGDPYPSEPHDAASGLYNPYLDASITWKDIDWLRETMSKPLVCKGILHPEDARLAIAHGADALICSNHGGRNLDGSPASIDALPRVVAAAGGRVPVLLDGGIRRGTDILKAAALGAAAVLIGRPQIWGLAAGGADGVAHVVELLRRELEAAMALCGTVALADVGPGVIWKEGVAGA
jgi:4-hydroxymandelate oxidase